MKNISIIRQELERRFAMGKGTTFSGFLVYANQYTDFVEKIPEIASMVTVEKNRLEERINSKIDITRLPNRHELLFSPVYISFKKNIQELLTQKWNKTISKNEQKGYRHAFIFLHDQILKRLMELYILDDPIEEQSSNSIHFDSDTRLLYLPGEEPININKQSRISNKFIVLEYIFKHALGTELYYDDILENAFSDTGGKYTKCSTACREINKQIFNETDGRIKAFLLFGTTKKGFAKVNPEYLSPK